MITYDVWQEDRTIDEAPKIAARKARELWGRDVSKGFVFVSGFNTDEIYGYALYASCDKPKDIGKTVEFLVAKAPIPIKEIKLLLYSAKEESPLESMKATSSLARLKSDLDSLDKKVRGLVLERLDPPFRDKVSAGKRLDVEYDVGLRFLIARHDGSRVLLDITAAFIQGMEDRTITLAKEIGEVRGYEISTVEDIEIDDQEETHDAISVFAVIIPSNQS
jgi:hypothetical protein